ncbi:MAG: hypothetical protein WD740_02745 [Anaerolineales bacterium]
MPLEQLGLIAEIFASIATVAAFLVVAHEIRKSRQSENRSQVLETKKMFQELFSYRKIASAMTWKSFNHFNKKYPPTSEEFWASQIVLEFFDTIGDSIRSGELEKLPMLRLWGTKATFYWWKFGDIISARNKEQNIETFAELKWLAEVTT